MELARLKRFFNEMSDNLINDKFLVCLHGEQYTCLALRKHHVNLLLQSFRSVSSDLHQC